MWGGGGVGGGWGVTWPTLTSAASANANTHTPVTSLDSRQKTVCLDSRMTAFGYGRFLDQISPCNKLHDSSFQTSGRGYSQWGRTRKFLIGSRLLLSFVCERIVTWLTTPEVLRPLIKTADETLDSTSFQIIRICVCVIIRFLIYVFKFHPYFVVEVLG